MEKIIINRIKCKRCKDILESNSTHDLKFCSCGAIGVDGGKDYLKRIARDTFDDIEELSIVEEITE